MRKDKEVKQVADKVVPVRLDLEQVQLLAEYRTKTGLSRNFIIRRCISYALQSFVAGRVDVLTLEQREKI